MKNKWLYALMWVGTIAFAVAVFFLQSYRWGGCP